MQGERALPERRLFPTVGGQRLLNDLVSCTFTLSPFGHHLVAWCALPSYIRILGLSFPFMTDLLDDLGFITQRSKLFISKLEIKLFSCLSKGRDVNKKFFQF